MQVSTVNKVQETRNSEKEADVIQSLSILGCLALGKSREQILRNEDVLSVQEQAVSEIEEANVIKKLFWRDWRKSTKIGKRK